MKATRKASRRKSARPRLAVVRSSAAPATPPQTATPSRTATPAPPPAFPQRAGASPKQLVMFELVRARAALLAAVQGLSPANANQPLGDGKWSVRETVLHLVTRDQARLREMEVALRGGHPSWQGVSDPEMDRINAQLLEPLRPLDWEEALRLLHRTRQQLMEEVESVPEEPAEAWAPEHPFGWMLHALPPHDRHHADIIKRWRAEHGA